MQTLYGMKVIESPLITEVPKLQLSHDFNACSPGFKAEMNTWLRQRFGTYFPAYVIGGHTIVLHPKHAAMLRLQAGMYN